MDHNPLTPALKRELRSRAGVLRDALGSELRQRLSMEACLHSTRWMQEKGISSMMVYLPFRSELDTWPMIHWAWDHGVTVAVPRSLKGTRDMELYCLSREDELIVGAYGIREPDPQTADAFQEIPEVIWVPGLAFDVQGGRLGYGGGYYDTLCSRLRALTMEGGKRPLWMGIGCSPQLMENVPMDDHDLRLDGLVTDMGLIKFDEPEGEEQWN
ncbi:5-formyltetrahydrofolate cyclo-ligase [Paenibacillus lemnae]|uniref:5-formyltetrahydrofolate cyclo-ligase n=1 Tax=Paenibacillus lemnae TaxID=1330551 RepID=A0A848M6C4_PAELE|nr:5-formyltetrahydrofolate cyclo-ligase [Paenibacillus lemnae]NMO95740.1 5-formyltetrahydrofolate cyclo-ligase [Paenibacillus lemnae]